MRGSTCHYVIVFKVEAKRTFTCGKVFTNKLTYSCAGRAKCLCTTRQRISTFTMQRLLCLEMGRFSTSCASETFGGSASTAPQHLYWCAARRLDMYCDGRLVSCLQTSQNMQELSLHARLVLPYLKGHSHFSDTGLRHSCFSITRLLHAWKRVHHR